jgi:hydrogenase-4 membrane subunit HyfE
LDWNAFRGVMHIIYRRHCVPVSYGYVYVASKTTAVALLLLGPLMNHVGISSCDVAYHPVS